MKFLYMITHRRALVTILGRKYCCSIEVTSVLAIVLHSQGNPRIDDNVIIGSLDGTCNLELQNMEANQYAMWPDLLVDAL